MQTPQSKRSKTIGGEIQMMDRENIFNLTQNILQNSDDGDALSNNDLILVEHAVNGYLTPRGEVVLFQLNHKITNGEYEIPWFCGVENLTRGYADDRSVFWKGIRVEHYDHDFWQSEGWQKNMIEDAEHLGRICQYLEANCIAVNFDNYYKYGKRVN